MGDDDNESKPAGRPPVTLIQLMILAAFLVFLGLLLMPTFRVPRGPPLEAATRAFMKSIETACAAYEFDWNVYPPDIPPNGGASSEALYYYLTTSFRTRPNPTNQQVLASMDAGPYLDVPEKLQKLTASGRTAILDVWGQPFEYDNIRDDKSTPTGFNSRGPGDPRTDGKPRNPEKFDIFSLGKPGQNHPITNFTCDWETR